MARECITSSIDKSSLSRFLLATLQLQYVLRAKGARSMKAALTTIPKSTDAAFENILQRIEQQDTNTTMMACRALTWCYYARRPLHMDELRVAVVVEDGDSEQRDGEPATSIVDCCLSFIAHDSVTGKVSFVHPSVQRWFDNGPQRRILLQYNYLANTCLTYLNYDVFDVSIDLTMAEAVAKYFMPYPFYRYVAQFWGDHTRAAEQESAVQNAALAFLAAENRQTLMLQSAAIINNRRYCKGQTALHVAASCGLAALCHVLLNWNIK